MKVDIYPIPLGFDRCYILKGEGIIMIDGGAPKKIEVFIKTLKKFSIKPEEIKLLIITHGHWDHIGSAKNIKEITGATLAMHKREKESLEQALKTLPPSITQWGKIFNKIMTMFMPFVHIPASKVDIALNDDEFHLDKFGIAGRVIYTPGHSIGSVSILLDTGEAFVGDLAMNAFPLRFSPGMPIFAEDMQKVKDSWKLLLKLGAKKIYPAHGNPFSAKIISNML